MGKLVGVCVGCGIAVGGGVAVATGGAVAAKVAGIAVAVESSDDTVGSMTSASGAVGLQPS
ncbi:MAG: hypothetical protein KDE09_08095 [Anaerolineales bacterium]|nr:hypothetical protein [Anaerolineales bacterium]